MALLPRRKPTVDNSTDSYRKGAKGAKEKQKRRPAVQTL